VDTARISALLKPFLGEFSLTERQLDQISIYIDLLKRWNARINLTAIRTEEEIVTRHFGESYFMASHVFDARGARTLLSANADSAQKIESKAPSPTPRVLDVGSGAGFPAIPLKLWAPQIHLTMIESNHKKAAFLREVSRTLTLTNVNVITDRAETLTGNKALQAEAVTLRAVEHFETILPQAASFLAPNARLALLIGEKQVPHLTALPNLKWHSPIPIPQSQTRVLAIGVRA
jgi:16S rRNA (guanine527-N7)-methyltransferase